MRGHQKGKYLEWEIRDFLYLSILFIIFAKHCLYTVAAAAAAGVKIVSKQTF